MTPKQTAFVREYMIDRNATQAAIRAGYSAKTAGVIGFENLKKPEIANAISLSEAQHAEKCAVSVESLTAEFEQARALAIANGQTAAAVSATTGKAKLHGFMDDRGPSAVATAVNFTTIYERD